MSYERCFGGGSRVTTSTVGKGVSRHANVVEYRRFPDDLCDAVAEELDLDPFNRPSLRHMPASYVSPDGDEAYQLTRLSS